jgi:type IX secretion system PorP/SprF family membrane protein
MLAICASIIFNFQLSTFNCAKAQDIHFSMFDLDPLLFNPAYSGFFDASARFGAVYRNQWASVSTPFQTISATAEVAFSRSQRNRNGFNGGLWLSNDRAGTLGYGSTTASAIVSYFQGLGDGRNIVSIGLEGGIGQVGFSTDGIEMTDGTESFNRTKALYPTLGAGVAWYCQVSDELYTKLGVSMRNINEPDISYTGMSDDTRLSRRFNIYGRAEWRFTDSWALLPVVGYQRQRNFNELVYGGDVRWYLNEEPHSYLAFSAGIIGRHADAAAINLAVMWREWTFAFCYDANISRLASASHTIGAFEVGIVYLMSKDNKRKRKAIQCPIF